VRPNVAILDESLAILDPKKLRHLPALVRLVSGIGMTTSMSWSGRSRLIFSARRSPMRSRALYTENIVDVESGRAKYTYSKMHGVVPAIATHCCAIEAALLVDEHRFAGGDIVAHHVEASISRSHALGRQHPFRALLVSRLPITSGRIPFGSRNPKIPWPITIATTA